jgi:hypothetical protein
MIKNLLARLGQFLVLGLLLAAPGEVLNQVLARHDWRAFRATMVSYFVLLLIGFFAGEGAFRLIRSRARAMTLYYLASGTFGLGVEWLLLGNTPTADPLQIITQPGMFTYWGTMLLGPRLIAQPAGSPRLRRSFIGFFVGFSVAYLAVAVLVPRDHGGIFFGFLIFAAGNVWLNYYYARYCKGLQLLETPAPLVVTAGP